MDSRQPKNASYEYLSKAWNHVHFSRQPWATLIEHTPFQGASRTVKNARQHITHPLKTIFSNMILSKTGRGSAKKKAERCVHGKVSTRSSCRIPPFSYSVLPPWLWWKSTLKFVQSGWCYLSIAGYTVATLAHKGRLERSIMWTEIPKKILPTIQALLDAK